MRSTSNVESKWPQTVYQPKGNTEVFRYTSSPISKILFTNHFCCFKYNKLALVFVLISCSQINELFRNEDRYIVVLDVAVLR